MTPANPPGNPTSVKSTPLRYLAEVRKLDVLALTKLYGGTEGIKPVVVVHQCNCTRSTEVKGLAEAVFKAYPAAHTRVCLPEDSKLDTRDMVLPGTISWSRTGNVTIVNCFAQLYPGKPKFEGDSYEKRQAWLRECLERTVRYIQEHQPQAVVLVPRLIGCGLAGGNPADYEKITRQTLETGVLHKLVYFSLPEAQKRAPRSLSDELSATRRKRPRLLSRN